MAEIRLDFGVRIKPLTDGIRRASKQIDRFQKRAQALNRGLNRAFKAGAVAFGAATAAVNKLTQTGDDIDKFSKRTGLAADEVQRLSHSATLAGSSGEALEKSLVRMAGTLLDAQFGLQTAIRPLNELGLALDELQGLDPDQQFLRIADALRDVDDSSRKAALAQDIFGRAGTQLIPLIDQGSAEITRQGDELERLGGIMSNEFVADSAAFRDELARARLALTGALAGGLEPLVARLPEFTSQLSQRIAPALRELGSSLSEVLASGGSEAIDSLANLAAFSSDVVLPAIQLLISGLDRLGLSLTELVLAIKAVNLALAGNIFGALATAALYIALTWDESRVAILRTLSAILQYGLRPFAQGIQHHVNAVVAAINFLIDRFNSLPGWLRGGQRITRVPYLTALTDGLDKVIGKVDDASQSFQEQNDYMRRLESAADDVAAANNRFALSAREAAKAASSQAAATFDLAKAQAAVNAVQSSSLPFLPSPEALRAAAGVGSSPQSFDYGTQFLADSRGGGGGSAAVSEGVAPHFTDAIARLDGLLEAGRYSSDQVIHHLTTQSQTLAAQIDAQRTASGMVDARLFSLQQLAQQQLDAAKKLFGVNDEEAPTFRRIEDYASLTLSEAEAQHQIALQQLKAEIDADGKRSLAEAAALKELEALRKIIYEAFGVKPEARGGQRIRYGDELLSIGGRNYRVNLDTGQLAEVGQTLPGQVPPTPVVNVNVEGSVIAESELRGVVVDAVNEGQRRGELLPSA
ncbi:MAG: hypothetical protein OXT70_01285 [Chloroflexota bacterium]|nr:hypothetical protein [Chloroflexota bacterium]